MDMEEGYSGWEFSQLILNMAEIRTIEVVIQCDYQRIALSTIISINIPIYLKL